MDQESSNASWTGGEAEGMRFCLPSPGEAASADVMSKMRKYKTRMLRIQYFDKKYRLKNVERHRIKNNLAGFALEGALYEAEIDLPNRIEGGSYTLARYVAQGLDGVFFSLKIKYPYTREEVYVFNAIAALQRPQDDGWIEVCPLEICAGQARGAKIIKRNYEGDISTYDLDDFVSADKLNVQLDSFNHQVTNGIVGFQNSEGGFLLATQKQVANSMAFCPMRIRGGILYLNPFGTYYGRQRHHATYGNELGAQAAIYSAPQFFPLAPSYNGAQEEFLLAFFPFEGQPDEKIWEQARGFSEGSVSHTEIVKDFCVSHETSDADKSMSLKSKIKTGIPLKLQLKIMASGIKSLLGV
jgi:hypothetical protein